jgi:uncharacterized damage-inducible protein DinB
MKWFERQFTFDLPASVLPSVVERLRGTPARLEDRLLTLEPAVLIARPGDGTWSIQENAGHLLDLEPLWKGRIQDFLDRKQTLREADLSNRGTHEAGHNDRPLRAILLEFRRDRDSMVGLLESLNEEGADRTALHPRLGQPMRLIDHAVFVAEHDDHHLARITSLLRA